MLGEGIYVSATLEKALSYGDFTMKLLVYTGRTCRVDEQGHPKQKSWQTEYGSAWVPPNCGMVRSGRQVLWQFLIFTFMVVYGCERTLFWNCDTIPGVFRTGQAD